MTADADSIAWHCLMPSWRGEGGSNLPWGAFATLWRINKQLADALNFGFRKGTNTMCDIHSLTHRVGDVLPPLSGIHSGRLQRVPLHDQEKVKHSSNGHQQFRTHKPRAQTPTLASEVCPHRSHIMTPDAKVFGRFVSSATFWFLRFADEIVLALELADAVVEALALPTLLAARFFFFADWDPATLFGAMCGSGVWAGPANLRLPLV